MLLLMLLLLSPICISLHVAGEHNVDHTFIQKLQTLCQLLLCCLFHVIICCVVFGTLRWRITRSVRLSSHRFSNFFSRFRSLFHSHHNRVKNSRSSIDAQTISTVDSTGDQSGFYRNYQQAWENLRFTGHSASYKPTRGDEHSFGQRRTYNEGYRDSNEITLNADVAALYSRPDGRSPPQHTRNGKDQWQRRKY